jgi:hypothetical protein
MERDIEDQQTIRRYLLGESGEDEQRSLEESLLVSKDLFEELLIAEDELVDEYLAGDLGEAERESFEKHFLSTPERLRKLRFARAFKKHLANATGPSVSPAEEARPASWKRWLPAFLRGQNPVLGFSLATVLLAVGVCVWLFVQSYRGPQTATDGGPSVSNFFPVTLTPGAVRDAGEMKRVVIPKGADAVQLRLELAADEYRSYRAALRTDEGREVFTGGQLAAEKAGGVRVVALVVPAKLLTGGDYQVKLSGADADGKLEDVGSYYFRVVQR